MEDRHEVFIPTKGAENVMPMVRYLRDSGLVQGRDFDFKYQQSRFNWGPGAESWFERSGVTFYMRDEKWITFLRIKFSDEINKPLPRL
jgi:hypothetical protein